MENEQWKSEYELRGVIDIATRYEIESIYKSSRISNNHFSLFNPFLTTARENFDSFCYQLREKLANTQNWKPIEIDLKYRFLVMINQYLEWYEINKKETEKFEPYNPYNLMFNIIERTKNEILKYFPDIEGSKRIVKKQEIGYEWQSNPNKELPELYSLMNKYKLIAPETTIEQFTGIFTGQPIESIEPIKWRQDNASELLYFIDRLEQSKNIVHNPKRADYQKMTACFVKPDGKPFSAAWKSLKTNIEISLSSDKQKAIDELVNNF